MAESIYRRLYKLFFESSTAYAEAYTSVRKGKEVVGYSSIAGLPTLKDIKEHILGDRFIGAYTVHSDHTVTWCAFDIDAAGDLAKAREIAKKISDFLTAKGIPHGIEFSGGKGYHIWIFFIEKVSAARVKAVLDHVRDTLGLPKNGNPHVEVFPKQAELSDSNPLGSLLRVPLGLHPKTKKRSIFVDPEDSWEDGAALDPVPIFEQKISIEDLEGIVEESDTIAKLAGICIPYWIPTQRHNATLWLSGYLAELGWPIEETKDLIKAINQLDPEGELEDQLKAVESTYKNFFEGKPVMGMGGLSTIMPIATLNDITKLAAENISPSILLAIDRIRLGKDANFLKIRSAASTIVSHLVENGKLVRDGENIRWLDIQTRNLTAFNTQAWTRYLHNFFGVNIVESFGRSVTESIKQLSYDKAREVQVKKRSFFDDKTNTEYMNLGGPEIYIFNGDPSKREMVYNGEIDFIFDNQNDEINLPNLLMSSHTPISPWTFLTDDVNFGGEDADFDQQKELFKAFFISTFFMEIMPTKPLLTILGNPGQGKTTAARRMLRLVEGWTRDVSTINDDKPDSFRVSVAHSRLVVFDNIELNTAKWLPDNLNRLSTGAAMELRELHTTNSMLRIQPKCSAILTATKMPFSEETVYTRMLPIFLGEITGRRAEYLIQADLINNYESLWLGTFDVLDDIVYQLRTVKTAAVPDDVRLADFAIFCSRIKDADNVDGKALIGGLNNLTNQQKQTLEKNSPFIEILSALLDMTPGKEIDWITMSELSARCQKTANLRKLEWRWNSVQGLSKHFDMLKPKLIQHYGMRERVFNEGGRTVKKYRFVKPEVKIK